MSSEIDEEIYQQILVLSEAGDDKQLEGDRQGAVDAWRAAIELVPEPKTFWDASSWLYGSIGYVVVDVALELIALGERDRAGWVLVDARDALVEALASPGGAVNPLVLIRRGQVELELGDRVAAREWLLRAYMLDGETVFEGESPVYLDVLRDAGDLP